MADQVVHFTTVTTTKDYQPYADVLQQVVPVPGLVFSITDNGYGNGSSRAYVVKSVGKLNRAGFPKNFEAYVVARTPFDATDSRRHLISMTSATEGDATVDVEAGTSSFKFQRRDSEAYYRDRISFLAWGKIIADAWFDK